MNLNNSSPEQSPLSRSSQPRCDMQDTSSLHLQAQSVQTAFATHFYISLHFNEVQPLSGEVPIRGKLPVLEVFSRVIPGEFFPLFIPRNHMWRHDIPNTALTSRVTSTYNIPTLFCVVSDDLRNAAPDIGIVCEVVGYCEQEDNMLALILHALERCKLIEPATFGPWILVERIIEETNLMWKIPPFNTTIWPGSSFAMKLMQHLHFPNNSYELARTLPLDNALRHMLVSLNSEWQRAHFLWKTLSSQVITIQCARCAAVLVEDAKTHVTKTATFVNPSNNLFVLLCCDKVTNVTSAGFHSAEFSWFEGFTWSMALCQRCHHHLGWEYREKRLLAGLRMLSLNPPRRFWGIHTGASSIHINNNESVTQ